MTDQEYKNIIEAILFTMGDAVELSKIAKAIEVEKSTAKRLLKELADEYEINGRGIRIIALDESYQMCTDESMYDYLIKIAKQPERHVLTDVMLETLSIVAYRQPITRGEIEKIRGVSCDHAINRLIEYGLVTELGRLDAPGHPILFGTTEEFLRRFDVQSINDLPRVSPESIEQFKEEAERETPIEGNV